MYGLCQIRDPRGPKSSWSYPRICWNSTSVTSIQFNYAGAPLTECIRTRDNDCRWQYPSSKPRGRCQRRQGFRFLAQRARCKIVQVHLVRATSPCSSVGNKEGRDSILYPANCIASTRREYFPLEMVRTTAMGIEWEREPTNPFPSRTAAGRQHSCLESFRISRYVWLTIFWIL